MQLNSLMNGEKQENQKHLVYYSKIKHRQKLMHRQKHKVRIAQIHGSKSLRIVKWIPTIIRAQKMLVV